MTIELWKVGELARSAGLSVRTLHHYDEIGLLVPSHRGTGGHRLYTARDVARLERIVVLKGLGLALEDIAAALARPDAAPSELLRQHLAELRARIALEQRLASRLEALGRRLEHDGEATLDDLIETLETMTMYEKHYTPEQLEQLKQRADALGPEAIAAVQDEWPRLIAAVRAEREAGTDPSHARVQALAKRWQELVRRFTGGDPDLTRSLGNLYRSEPAAAARQGLDPELFDYVRRAQQSAGE